MPKNHTLLLEHTFNGDFETVYRHLLDLREFGKIHPYMTSVQRTAQTETHCRYEIHEKLLVLGFLPQRPHYFADVLEPEKGRMIRYRSQVKKNIQLDVLFTFSDPAEQPVRVKEEITVTGNGIVSSVFIKLLRKTHLQVFENLHKKLAGNG